MKSSNKCKNPSLGKLLQIWEIPGSFGKQKKKLVKCVIFNKYRDLEIFLKFSALLNTFSLHYFYLSLRLPKLLFSEAIITKCQCIFSLFCRRPYQVAQKLQTCRLRKKARCIFCCPFLISPTVRTLPLIRHECVWAKLNERRKPAVYTVTA